MIEFKNVYKKYDNGTEALKNVNLRIERGEFVFIVGASGSGKSTFLKTIMREEVPTSGSIMINNYDLTKMTNKEIPYFRRTMGIVFQDFRLIPTMTVYDNVAFAMRVIGANEKEIRKRVPFVLSLVGLKEKARSLPNEISGGEQQRVALARALVNNANTIIADEPTGNIDPEMSYEIVDLLNHINENGTTVIMVTHEHDLVKKFNHRIVVIDDGTVVSDTAAGGVLRYKTETGYKPVSEPGSTQNPNTDEAVKVAEAVKAAMAAKASGAGVVSAAGGASATGTASAAGSATAAGSASATGTVSAAGSASAAQQSKAKTETTEKSFGTGTTAADSAVPLTDSYKPSPFMAQMSSYAAKATAAKDSDTADDGKAAAASAQSVKPAPESQPTQSSPVTEIFTIPVSTETLNNSSETKVGSPLSAARPAPETPPKKNTYTTIDGVDYSKYFEDAEEDEK